MHVWKSCVVIIYLFVSFVVSVCLIGCSVYTFRKNSKFRLLHLYTVFVCVATILSFLVLNEYTNPYEQAVEIKLYATLDIPSEHTLSGPPTLQWHAAYEKHGLNQSSRYFDVEDIESESSYLGCQWPAMDFENYTYIITYGQELESLSYNVWETIDYPLRTGAKDGHVVLSSKFDPNKVYIYQIPKMAIDNDI